MELIIFASLYQAKEVLIFYVHFFYRRTFYSRGAVEVVLPFFHMKKALVAKNSEDYADALLRRLWGLSSPVVGSLLVGRFTSRRFCQVCLGTGEFLRPQGAIPPGFDTWGAPKKGNADEVEGIFDFAGRVWASALRPDPT